MGAFEIACGEVLGGDLAPAPLSTSTLTPADALEQALLPALARPPCLVHFSGGIDSSLLLALALRAARHHGLEAPVAYTRRYPGLAESGEDEWQETVVAHLSPLEWEKRVVTDEADLVGPVAAPSLRRHGVLWPSTVHTHGPDLERARGGSMVSGEGGDEVFGPRRLAPLRALVTRRVRATRRNVVVAGLALAPVAVRRAAARHDLRGVPTPWLRPAARRALEDALAHDAATEPYDWRRAVQAHPRRRGVYLAQETMRTVAAEADVLRVDPLLDPGFLAAYTTAGGRLGPLTRVDAARRFFGDLLPSAVVERRSKATFNGAVWNVHTRAFLERWNGEGVDPALVDVDALRAVWAAPQSNAMSFSLLQSCWLAADTDASGR